MSDAVRKKQGGRASFDEIGDIAAHEASIEKSLCYVEGGCKMDVPVFHSGAAPLDGCSLYASYERVHIGLFRTELSGHPGVGAVDRQVGFGLRPRPTRVCSRDVTVVATVFRPGIRPNGVRDGGGGGSRSATIVEFSSDFENSIGSIGEKRQKAPVGRYDAIERTDVGGVIAPAAFPSLQIAVRDIFE